MENKKTAVEWLIDMLVTGFPSYRLHKYRTLYNG